MAGILVLLGLAVLAVPVLLIVALVAISGLKRRVADLERQVSQLRVPQAAVVAPEAVAPAPADTGPTLAELVRSPPPRVETPPPVQASTPPPIPPRQAPPPEIPAQPAAALPPRPPRDEPPPRPAKPDVFTVALRAVQRWFTVGNVPVKIGVLVLFAGVAALLKYGADQGWFSLPPELRLAGIAAAALGALVFAWRKRDSNRTFALSLQGGAIGVLLLVVFAAVKIFGVIPAGAAFALSIVLIAGAGMLAVLQDAKSLAVFALLAGFLAPIWLSTGSGNHVALFSYYAVLNAAIVGIAWYKSWRVLNLLGFVFTFGIGTAWALFDYAPEKYASTQPFLALFFVFYLLIPLLFARRQPAGRRDFIDGCLVFGMPLVAFSLQAGLMQGGSFEDSRLPLAFCALGLGMLYAGLSWTLRRRANYDVLAQSYALLAVGFATLSVPLALSAQATACVFALEGAALAWLGLRQSRLLPQLTGAGLQIAAAVAFFIAQVDVASWRESVDATMFANASFMSALLITVAGFASAWVYRARGHGVALVYYLWALAWWLGNGMVEIDTHVAYRAEPDALLAFAALTGWLAAEVHRHRPSTALAWTTLAALASAVPFALWQSEVHQQPFAGHGAWAWLAYAVLGVRSLMCLRDSDHRLAGAAQFVWWLVWPLVASLLLAWLPGHVEGMGGGWQAGLIALPWLVVVALALFRWDWLAAPLGGRFDAWRTPLFCVLFVALGLWWLVSLFMSGDAHPLPWIPVLNPMELAQLATLVLLLRWWMPEARVLPPSRIVLLSSLAFVWITSVVLHAVHHWGGVPWNEGLLSGSLAQTSLTVTWSVLGVLGWVIGSRRGQRMLWLGGAVLMGVVLAKLVFVDRQHLGNLLGIGSFIAYGLLCTVVGYLAPAPPRRVDNEEATT
ncbi:DUF2339 domain-containing protein [Pseudoxanthomonas japonensis]|uniref:DUF2339 domain-containing protein n=1 Tax=Pseudoxanthomonas japonensis TaxID=69284 RepID=UPI000DB76406|nr:DUF2339 domain-containing protein [Pseudoxanthomonas japonensis]PZQ33679.1 MAG: DUF2339 domain-containing protein [Stenotrophomonas acidaminiphila]